MMRRTSADRFATLAGKKVQLFLRSSRNNGIASGAFHYAGKPLTDEIVNRQPGCSLVPLAGVQQFRVTVDFDPGAPSARYDLFEFDQDNGSEVDLQEHRLATDFDGIIGFGINGVAAPATLAPSALARATAAKPAKKKTAKRPTKKAKTKKAKTKKAKTQRTKSTGGRRR